MSKEAEHSRQLLLGLFLLVTLSVLGFYTLFLTDFQLFGSPVILVAQFPEAHDLREGDPVTVAGMRAGRVRDIRFDPAAPREQRITVELKLNEPLELREGYRISIEEATMLGGRAVDIDPGRSDGASVSTAEPLPGDVVPSALAGLGDLVDENRAAVQRFFDNLAVVSDDLVAGRGAVGRALRDEALGASFSQGMADFAAFAADARQLSTGLVDGQGTLGKLFTDDELHENLRQVSERLRATLDDLHVLAADTRAGRGTLGRLFTDDALGEEVAQALRSIRSIADRVARGEGTVGRLLSDDTIARNLEKITGDVATGKGTLGQLIASDDVYRRLLTAADGLSSVVVELQGGEGTLGLLIKDRELYEEALTAVKLLNSSLEDYREAAPITSFTSVLFSAF